jgi:prepilin signal peptidase PulO-like enzyme (type II secretory pathway)
MDYLIYILIFFIGALCGSFIALAVYRIPLKQNITNKRSYCPKCEHKLGFFDLIPIFSYIFLRGKCRYCKEKIGLTNFLVEILTGVIFVLFAASIKFSIFNITQSILIYFIIGLIYITLILIISGIDKQNININKSALVVGFAVVTLYLIYLYITERPIDISMYRYVIYLLLACFLVFFSIIYLKRKGKDSYTIDILMLSIFMILYTYEAVYIYTVMITLIAIALQLIIHGILNRKKNSKYVKGIKNESSKIPIGFYMGFANLMALIITNFTIFYL